MAEDDDEEAEEGADDSDSSRFVDNDEEEPEYDEWGEPKAPPKARANPFPALHWASHLSSYALSIVTCFARFFNLGGLLCYRAAI
jgi:hypothetical protein